MKARIIVMNILLGLAACSGGTGTNNQVGGSYSQCDNLSPGSSDSSSEVTAVINNLVPVAAPIQCTGKQLFQFNGRPIYFVIVPYGQLNDCPSGCFSSEVCSIVDGQDTLLYSGVWYSSNERPNSIPPDCPELGTAEYGDTILDCTSQPSGYSHPITQTTEFADFRQSEINNNGHFRFCFY